MSERIGRPFKTLNVTGSGEGPVRRRTSQLPHVSENYAHEVTALNASTQLRLRNYWNVPTMPILNRESQSKTSYISEKSQLQDLGADFYLNSEYIEHSLRLEEMIDLLADLMGIPKESKDRLYLRFGARYHDIGKIDCIDLMMLPTKLSPQQQAKAHEHPDNGARRIPKKFAVVREIVRTHHRDPIGGYPNEPFNQNVLQLLEHPAARLLAEWALGTLDPLEAMWSERPYRPRALTLQESENELRRLSGKEFHPEIVELLIGKKTRFIEKLYALHTGTKQNPGLYHLHEENNRYRADSVVYAEETGYESSHEMGSNRLVFGQGRRYRIPYYRDNFYRSSWIIKTTRTYANRLRSTLRPQ
jgi:hypothetical protein